MKDDKISVAVEEHYAAVARGEQSACGMATDVVAKHVGYTEEELACAGDANLGLGCGNPLAMAQLEPGMTVLDLGSGAGFDAFLALSRVGATGRVIGVDMTDDMLKLAQDNAAKRGATNVEFRKGFIEQLPVEDNSVDFIISNCVINLSTDKPAVFHEIHRVLKRGGRFAISDIVALKPLPEELASSISAYVGCIAGASLMGEYISMALHVGLCDLSVPQIQHGLDFVNAIAPEGALQTTCGCSASLCSEDVTKKQLIRAAAEALASIKLHGRK